MDESDINRSIDEHVRPYIDLIDSLRSLGVNQDIPLPQVYTIYFMKFLFISFRLPWLVINLVESRVYWRHCLV